MTDKWVVPEKIFGTWRLVKSRAVDASGGPIRDPWGPVPMGRLVLDPGGRMMAVLCDGRRQMPAGEERAYSSYCGNFKVENNVLTTIIDAASDPARIGSSQPRILEFRGDLLVLKPPLRSDGEQRELFWQRESLPA